MENKPTNYSDAVKAIKTAILQSQYEAIKSVNEKQLTLYFAIGKYISANTRNGHFGEGAIDAISEQLQKEMPGLRGFSSTNMKYMRIFYEEWQMLENEFQLKNSDLSEFRQTRLTIWKDKDLSLFFNVGFSIHMLILNKIKDFDERLYYIEKSALEHLSYRELFRLIESKDYQHRGMMPNNFERTLTPQEALHAIGTFKDQYALDFINTEELNVRDYQDVDERVLENKIVHNIKNFILTFGKRFSFIGNQYHLVADGEDFYIDLLFFNRELNCLVAIELKTGKFKTSYLGQLSGYLSLLDKFEKLPDENPSIGIVLCKSASKTVVDYVIHDYNHPMGVATYKTSQDMSKQLQEKLPSIDELKKLLDSEE